MPSLDSDPLKVNNLNAAVVVHECVGHQMEVRACSGHHDNDPAWCDVYNHCSLGAAAPSGVALCVMPDTVNVPQFTSGLSWFDSNDLLFGDPACLPDAGQPRAGAIRTNADPK